MDNFFPQETLQFKYDCAATSEYPLPLRLTLFPLQSTPHHVLGMDMLCNTALYPFHSFYFTRFVFASAFTAWGHSPTISVPCGRDKLGCMSPILSFNPSSQSEAAGQRRGGLPVWKDVAVAVPCSSSSLAPATGAEAEVNVQAEDRSICFSSCYKTSHTKVRSLCCAASYLVLRARSHLLCTAEAHKAAQDCLSHSSPCRSSLSSAAFPPSDSCRVGFAKWHKVIINQVRRFVLCFLLYRRAPYGLITSSVRQIYVYKISEVVCNCQDPVVWFETSMQWTPRCCRCTMKYKCKMEEVKLSS